MHNDDRKRLMKTGTTSFQCLLVTEVVGVKLGVKNGGVLYVLVPIVTSAVVRSPITAPLDVPLTSFVAAEIF